MSADYSRLWPAFAAFRIAGREADQSQEEKYTTHFDANPTMKEDFQIDSLLYQRAKRLIFCKKFEFKNRITMAKNLIALI